MAREDEISSRTGVSMICRRYSSLPLSHASASLGFDVAGTNWLLPTRSTPLNSISPSSELPSIMRSLPRLVFQVFCHCFPLLPLSVSGLLPCSPDNTCLPPSLPRGFIVPSQQQCDPNLSSAAVACECSPAYRSSEFHFPWPSRPALRQSWGWPRKSAFRWYSDRPRPLRRRPAP